MNTLEILFFVLLFIVFYTYVGYGILLWIFGNKFNSSKILHVIV